MSGSRRRTTARIAIAAVLATSGAATVAIQPATAGRPGRSFYGDLNHDGLPDRVTLAVAPPDRCAVRVERRRPGGGYRTPRTYDYPEPGGGGFGACPDLGVVVDLGGDGRVELVLGWFAGRPPGADHDLLVLRGFAPAGGFPAVFQPSFLGTAEFDGDDRTDVYEWTDQGEGFRSYLNGPDGRLVPGPVQWCFLGPPQVELADFQHNRRADVAIAYSQGCDGSASGVVVVRDDGSPVHLERDPSGAHQWSMDVRDVNQDRRPDVRTEDRLTGAVTHHLGRGDGTFVGVSVGVG